MTKTNYSSDFEIILKENSASVSKENDLNFLKQQDKSTVISDVEQNEVNKPQSDEHIKDIQEDLYEYEDTDNDNNIKVFDKEVIEEIVSVNTSSVDNVILNLDKISQTAFNADRNITLYQGITRKIAMESRVSKKEINALVSINFDFNQMNEKGEQIRGTEKLTPFDRIVLDAVHTLYFEGHNEYITTSMVFHVMAGDKDKFISPKYAEEINNSLIKLLFTHITIDASEEAKMYPALKNFKYHSTILPGDMIQAKLNGTEVACIHIHTKPILYLYAQYKKQVSKIDINIIKKPFTKDKKESKEQMTLLYYLLRRIIALKSLSNRIRYETLYHEFGYSDASSKNKFDLRKRAKTILDLWKGVLFGNIEFIDYTEEKDGKTPCAIILNYKIVKQKQ